MLFSMYQTMAAIQMAHILICFNISFEPLLVAAATSIQPLYSNNPLIGPKGCYHIESLHQII